ncbi:MAG: filamentous hemagglutinin N-terminal domain-containing protein [Rhodospirillales bacterium]|nr:filamentous hemagglutinin N-terminal domain-containing protein [Rhodospirillales bacterium]
MRVARRSRAGLLVSTALQAAVLLVLAAPARAQLAPNARPMGGVVAAGNAQISTTATNTQIDQSSQRAVVDWRSFNVGSAQSVTFQQPGAGAVTLNRVTTPHPSEIAGRITANGQVVIVNQSGVVFANSAEVNTQSLVVSAAGITNDNFMHGRMKFDIPARPNARIVNHGHITVGQAGLAALVAPAVANSGVITAKLGHVVLAGATTHTVDLYGDGLLSVDVGQAVTKVPVGRDGKPVQALVTNTGTIVADGGTVQLTARAADGIVTNLVDAGGHIAADSVGAQTGTVRIIGLGGSIVVDGQVSAAGRAAGTTGGQIELNASGNVTVAPTARVDASGRAGGGLIAVGTTLARARGGATAAAKLTARRTVIAHGAMITADATQKGQGGRVTVLSGEMTDVAGTVSARGGPLGGNGGFVELSGELGFALSGVVDVSAVAGTDGTILIDPQDLTIIAGGANPGLLAGSGQNGSVDVANNGGGTVAISSSLDPAAFDGLKGSVILQASRDLTVSSGFTAQASSLVMQAGRNLTVDAPITMATNNSTLSLAAAVSTAAFTAAPGYDAVLGPTGVLTITANGGITASNGSVILASAAGGISVLGPITAGNALTISTTNAGAVSLGAGVTAGTASVTAGSIAVPASLSATTVSLDTTGTGGTTIDIAGTLNASGSLSATAGTALTAAGTIIAGTLSGSASSAQLTGANTITTLGAFSATAPAGTIDLVNTAGSLVVGGVVQAGTSGGLLSLASDTLRIASGGSLTAPSGTIEITPFSAGTTISLGGVVSGDLSLRASDFARISTSAFGASSAGTVRLGQAAAGGHAASAIVMSGGTMDSTTAGTTLELDAGAGGITQTGGTLLATALVANSQGGITQSGGKLIATSFASGAGITGNVLLSAAQIATLGTITVSGGNFGLVDSATSLSVAGALTVDPGRTVSLATNKISVPGSITAIGGTV